MNSFRKKRESFLPLGLPRNDILFEVKNNDEARRKYKLKFANKYNFPVESELILYVPTFRPYKHGNKGFLSMINTFNEVFVGSNKKLLVRLHPHDFSLIDKDVFGNTVVSVSDYPDVQELLAVSDIMITDYSSIIFDYSIWNVLFICFHMIIHSIPRRLSCILTIMKYLRVIIFR